MGDIPGENQPPGGFSSTSPGQGPQIPKQPTPITIERRDSQDLYGSSPTVASPGSDFSFQSQFQQQFYRPYPNTHQMHPISPQSNIAQAQGPSRSSSFSVASLGAALPDLNYVQTYTQQQSQGFPPGSPNPPLAYQIQQNPQFPGQAPMNQLPGSQYSMQHPQQYQGHYSAHPQAPGQVQQSGSSPGRQFITTQNFVAQGLSQPVPPYYYQAVMGQSPSHIQSPVYQTSPSNPYPAPYGGWGNLPGDVGQTSQTRSSNEQTSVLEWQSGGVSARSSSIASSSGQVSTPRGPPRKPKLSGHALWVGNLPPGTIVVNLKDHFSREATNDILSVFLISKSNCAFVNYKTEDSCTAAMNRFHDSWFQGVRLVCRLRRSSTHVAPGVPTGPAALSTTQPAVVKTPDPDEAETQEAEKRIGAKERSAASPLAKDRYFIVKSLTVEDLELSVRNGIWATQSHNEEVLNKAYGTADVVYLIFSANKSGEYFGYARMMSLINDDPAAAIKFTPKMHVVEELDLPKAIPTAPSEWAPKGRIIDDSARGTIFWEADSSEGEGAGDSDENSGENSDNEADDIQTKTWGKPFKVEWLCMNRLPFYRTRGLRNPWNSNREVKIARDGTEIETSTGRRLIAMFHREATTVAPAMPQIMGGYPQMRLY